ncbi:MAG: PQQ-like beta-propeller repeat protein, partial [Verrucomicrobia bacterium]|nr:PQQ-like beta-propeller repeat protein [Verrucomicrobiota bacterium]
MNSSKLFTSFATVSLVISAPAADWPIFRGSDQTGISAESVDAKRIAAGVTPLWKGRVGTGFSSISVADGRIYTMGNDAATDTVWCLDAATGKEIWKHSYPEELKPNLYEGGPNATPTVSGGRVFT